MTNGYYSSANGIGTWSGWSGVAPSGGLTLSLDATLSVSLNGGSCHNAITYTLDGQTWSTFVSSIGNVAQAHYSAAVPAGTNLALVQVTASSLSAANGGGLDTDAEGSITIANLKIA